MGFVPVAAHFEHVGNGLAAASAAHIPCYLCAGTVNRKEIEMTYKISRRIEAEERALENAMMVFTSTQQEVDEQWGLYESYALLIRPSLSTLRLRQLLPLIVSAEDLQTALLPSNLPMVSSLSSRSCCSAWRWTAAIHTMPGTC